MSAPHPAPAALDALVALVIGAFDGHLVGGKKVRVEDGPPTTDLQEQNAVGIGVSVEDVVTASGQAGFALASTEEPFDVGCVAQSWSGDGNLPVLRQRVFELLDVITGVLAVHPDLGLSGVWDARVSGWNCRTSRSDRGASALIEFTVRINAYR